MGRNALSLGSARASSRSTAGFLARRFFTAASAAAASADTADAAAGCCVRSPGVTRLTGSLHALCPAPSTPTLRARTCKAPRILVFNHLMFQSSRLSRASPTLQETFSTAQSGWNRGPLLYVICGRSRDVKGTTRERG